MRSEANWGRFRRFAGEGTWKMLNTSSEKTVPGREGTDDLIAGPPRASRKRGGELDDVSGPLLLADLWVLRSPYGGAEKMVKDARPTVLKHQEIRFISTRNKRTKRSDGALMRRGARFENAHWARAGALIALWFLFVSVSDASAKDANSPREILSHEYTIAVPKLIGDNLVWSPDARFVALAQYGKKALYLIDVDERTLSEVTLPGAVADPEIAWSPDGKYLALTDLNLQPRPGAPPGIRLLMRDGEEVGRVDGSTVDCWFNPKSSLAFSPTSSSLWSACSYIPRRDTGKPFILAVELRVPDLKLLNVIPGDPDNTGLQQSASRHFVSTIAGRHILTSILSSSTNEIVEVKPLPPPHQPVIRYRGLYRVRTVDLKSMRDVAPVLSFKSEAEFYRGPNKAVYFPRSTPPSSSYRLPPTASRATKSNSRRNGRGSGVLRGW
jgi:hypothetical protein